MAQNESRDTRNEYPIAPLICGKRNGWALMANYPNPSEVNERHIKLQIAFVGKPRSEASRLFPQVKQYNASQLSTQEKQYKASRITLANGQQDEKKLRMRRDNHGTKQACSYMEKEQMYMQLQNTGHHSLCKQGTKDKEYTLPNIQREANKISSRRH